MTRTPSALTQRIIHYAQLAATTLRDDDVAPAEHDLAELLLTLLDRRLDRPINQAIRHLHENHEHNAAEIIDYWADDTASVVDYKTRDGVPMESTAFLLPIVVVSEHTATDSMHAIAPFDSVLQTLAQSFGEHGLIEPRQAITLLPGLYRLEDLPQATAWSDRRAWLQAILSGSSPEAGSSGDGYTFEAVATLRFIVGVVHAPTDDVSVPFLTPDADLLDWAAWIAMAQDALEQWGPPSTMWLLLGPQAWGLGLELGLRALRDGPMAYGVANYLNQAHIPLDDAIADILWDATHQQWRVCINDNRFLQESPLLDWPCLGDDPLGALHDLQDHLWNLMIRRWTVDGRGGGEE